MLDYQEKNYKKKKKLFEETEKKKHLNQIWKKGWNYQTGNLKNYEKYIKGFNG